MRTSSVEVTHVSRHGIRILAGARESFMALLELEGNGFKELLKRWQV